MILRARVLLGVERPPVEDGVVIVEGHRCVEAGAWRDWRPHLNGPVTDLGGVALLPGLVNAHCHLDYTHMAGCLPPAHSFTHWIQGILALKGGWSYTEYAESWLAGARMLLQHGTTTVADIEAVPELLPETWQATPLRVLSFLEVTNVRYGRDPQAALDEALRVIGAMPPGRSRAFLSPHAPYSTSPRLLQLAASVSCNQNWPLTTHVAESDEEFAMFANGQGPMFDWLRRNGRDMSDCGQGSPVAVLDRLEYLCPRLIAVHLNYLAGDDAQTLGRRGAHVVHCPRSHAYFHHRRFPLEELQSAGVNVALGTDSLATVRCSGGQRVELDLFAEMQTLAAAQPGMAPARILQMATTNAARALGLGEQLGRLGKGSAADLIAVPISHGLDVVEEEVIQHRGPVCACMIDGGWVLEPDGRGHPEMARAL